MSAGSPDSSRSALATRMARLRIAEADIEEQFARSSGPGGQHVNKVSTAVTLTHLPTGFSVTVQDSRSQAMNRHLARVRLVEKIESERRQRQLDQRAAAAKRRRQRARRSPGTKRKMVADKRHRSEIKKGRARVE